MRFVATEHRRDGDYSVTIRAATWEEARAIARRERLTLEGRLLLSIPKFRPDWIPDVIVSLLWFFGVWR